MKTRQLLLAIFSLLMGWGTASLAQAAPPSTPTGPSTPVVSFEAGDSPGNFFTCINTGNSKSGFGCVPQLDLINTVGQKSIAVIAPGETIGFPTYSAEASTVHTALSLIYPTGAKNMPFKAAIDVRDPAKKGVATVTLRDPGLYVFICDIHVYMFAAVIVDDPKTKVDDPNNILQKAGFGPIGLDLGKKISLVNGITVPTYSDLAVRLLRTFFILTNPGNWKDYSKDSWTPVFPAVPVIVYGADGKRIDVANLHSSGVLSSPSDNDNPKDQLHDPVTPPVGEIWVDTQFELTAGKSKPGTATAVAFDETLKKWVWTKKIALPTQNMNHPHNMWTDKNQKVIYQTQWFDERMSVFDRVTGEWKYDRATGPAPSHVMTRADNDQVHVAQNGGNNVREFEALEPPGPAFGPNEFIRNIPMGSGGEDVFSATHPHGHWMSHDGKKMVTPNENVNSSTVYKFVGTNDGVIEATIPTGHVPIATGMMPDSSKYYVSNLLDSTISRIDMNTNQEILPRIDLLANYNAVTGDVTPDTSIVGAPVGGVKWVGALPVQTAVSPDGTNMVTANTLTGTITIVDTRSSSPNKDKVVAMLPCDPGCHGVQYGAKQGGGYYAYVASKFGNALVVVDPAPGGNPVNAVIAGRVLLGKVGETTTDFSAPDKVNVIGNPGMGGQGILPVPVVYNGWVQNLPASLKADLTCKQQHPVDFATYCQ